MKPKEVSPYKLNLFLQCRRQYYFEYLDPEIAPIKQQIKKKRPALEMGSFVHDSLTLFFKEEPKKRTWKTMSNILKNLWKGPRGEKGGFDSLEQEREYYYQSMKMLKWFVENENLTPSIFALPISPPGKSFDDYKKIPFAKNLELGGKIDRIDIDEKGNLEIIDYKTGKQKNGELQLIIYVFLAEGLFNKPVVKTSYLYLKSKTRAPIIPAKKIRQQVKKEILEIVEQIGKEKDWPPNPSKLCAYCDYIDFCPLKRSKKDDRN